MDRATLGNFLIPIMLGAKDLAFPKINLLSWYLYLIGGTLTGARRNQKWPAARGCKTECVNGHRRN